VGKKHHARHEFVTDRASLATLSMRMVSLRRTALIAIVVGSSACRGFSICDRPGVTTGQFVRAKTSLAYLASSGKGKDPSHTACRAEATIPATLGFMRESESELCNHTGVCAQGNGPDTVMTPNTYLRRAETASEGALRVLGIGRGIDGDDCGRVALEACDEAIDYYFKKEVALRPPTVVCTLADERVRCESAPVEMIAGPGG
jgi:hypothetical protein